MHPQLSHSSNHIQIPCLATARSGNFTTIPQAYFADGVQVDVSKTFLEYSMLLAITSWCMHHFCVGSTCPGCPPDAREWSSLRIYRYKAILVLLLVVPPLMESLLT